jgi:aspartyl-tRNA(Asn)/glutamyl-tRNA(Gln) amidotransferase subunit B
MPFEDFRDTRISAERLGEIMIAVKTGKLTISQARDYIKRVTLAATVKVAGSLDADLTLMGIARVDESALTELCKDLLLKNPKVVADVLSGKAQAISSLIGQAKKLNPNIDPGRFREICLELIQTNSV